MAAQSLFLTGTDTGVGKTYVASLLIRHLRARGVDAAGYKPVCCGDRGDAEVLAEASGISDIAQVNPLWFESPLAPLAAADREGRPVDRCAMLDGFEALASTRDVVVIEGAGGWEVPLTKAETLADLVVEFGAPVMVVAANRLGALNHTLLTIGAIRRRGLECAAVVLNHAEAGSDSDLAAMTNRDVLAEILPNVAVGEVENEAENPGGKFLEVVEGLFF